MIFEKQFTEKMVLDFLKTKNKECTRREIQIELKCSKMTAEHLLKSMMDRGTLTRRNVGTDKKPIWLYSGEVKVGVT